MFSLNVSRPKRMQYCRYTENEVKHYRAHEAIWMFM